MSRTRTLTVLVFSFFLALSSNGWGGDRTSDQQTSSQVASVKTYAPGDFRLSWIDRLSGGLEHQLPFRMAADSHGRIYLTDPGLSVVHVFDTGERKRWQIRGGFHHPLSRPSYITVDADDNVYITDLGLSAVLVFRPNGQFVRSIGSGILTVPTGIWVDRPTKTLYVADWWKSEILLFDLEGRQLRTVGEAGAGPGQLRGPSDLAVYGNTLMVLDTANSRFELFDRQGNFLSTRPFGIDRNPMTFAVDQKENLFYIDLNSNGLVASDKRGKLLASFAPMRRFAQWAPRPTQAQFICVTADALGNLLVLRPTLSIEMLRLAGGASGDAP